MSARRATVNSPPSQGGDSGFDARRAYHGLSVGDRVELLMHGDSEPYVGTVERPRKLWVKLDDGQGFHTYADEISISAWRLVGETEWRRDGVRYDDKPIPEGL